MMKLFNFRKICWFVILHLIFCSGIFATQMDIDKDEEARRYLDANLVIVGEVLSQTAKVIEEKEIPNDSGWVYHYAKSMVTYIVRIDSVLKGVSVDSTIAIQSASFKTDTWRSRFSGIVNEDSQFEADAILRGDDKGVNSIPESGKCIILLKKENDIYIPILCRDYTKTTLNFYKEIKKKGKDYFKKTEPPPAK